MIFLDISENTSVLVEPELINGIGIPKPPYAIVPTPSFLARSSVPSVPYEVP